MATKKYISKTCLSITVRMDGGKSRRVSFSPVTLGGSVYYTDNAEVQEALERHPFYGKLFKEEQLQAEVEPQQPQQEQAQDGDGGTPNHVKVGSLEEAKDYLSERYGVSRTKMRGEAAVKALAQAQGIEMEIEGPEAK